ncbi:MAG TPA: M1 family metallopeptidase [Gemmatimonadales bacterium]|nr:M1 family metallopeptidase [Gemmatimonadales bacterium]
MINPQASLRSLLALAAALALVPAQGAAQQRTAAPAAAPATHAQLQMPRDLQQAVAAGSRTVTGAPGPHYWQNHARYDIDMVVNPPSPRVTGSEEVVYYNESPDTLRQLGFKLINNIHKPGTARSRGAPPEFLTDGVQIDSFAVNGAATPFPSGPMVFTSPQVKLPAPLLPGDSIRLAVRWHYDLARGEGREGIIDSTTFYAAYFYPEVAVYDDYQGWDDIEFNGRQEFYTDFNDYDLTVHAPAGYVVWATGTLTNANQLLQPAALARYQASLSSDSVLHIATREQMLGRQVTTAGPTLAWHFTASDVPDVAFGLSDHYDWDGTSVVVDDQTHRRASAQAAFNDTAADYHHMAEYVRRSLDYFSHEWPGVPYPYPKSTAFQGFADMEYPMMINDVAESDTAMSRMIAEHEIAHTYMPFYMGIDQTRWGFMDEGWATTFEYFINRANMGVPWTDSVFRAFRVSGWIHDPSPAEDVPIITPEDVLGASVSYAHNAYGKAALGYLALHDMLGDAAFRRALHAYMDTWHGKHPSPWDFFYSINKASGRNLNWFWKAWYFDPSYIDLALIKVQRSADGYTLTVRNAGGMPAPFDVVLRSADGSTQRVHQTASVWERNAALATVHVKSARPARSITLDGGIWMDATPGDNVRNVQ